MNRLDRLTSILLQLQAKRIVKSSDLAKKYSISLRTVYRDMRTLEEAGVPIIGEAGVGFSLNEGYRLPPVMFSREEATVFLTAEKLVEKFTDSATMNLYSSALDKIKAVLRSEEKNHLDQMYEHIEVVHTSTQQWRSAQDNTLQGLLQNISLKEPILIEYETNYSKQKTQRKIEPFGVFLQYRYWYLVAYCWLRKDYRTFRIDCIKSVKKAGGEFALVHPPLKLYLKSLKRENRELKEVVIRVDNEILRFLGEQKFYNGFLSERNLGIESELTFITASLEGFARWFVMFGDHARIIKPSELREKILLILRQTQKNLKN